MCVASHLLLYFIMLAETMEERQVIRPEPLAFETSAYLALSSNIHSAEEYS